MEQGITIYSDNIPGNEGNYQWAVRFDKTRPERHTHEPGYIGITQFDEDGKLKERVLLSPAQMKALISFARKNHRDP
jgi:hypothetical protein